MADPQEEQRRAAGPTPRRAGAARRAIEKSQSSKRLKTPGKLSKNVWGKPAGKPRSGSDSNASRRTRGH